MKKELDSLEFTGERFVPGAVHGSIELEHLHRYLQASEIAAGKVVLDLASGEGYGSELIAHKALKVIGVDISAEAVAHARKRYAAENLEYMVGSCAEIPLPDASIDMVVSFETIEHHDQHEKMMQEIKRVLRKDGVLLISSPDKYYYSIEPANINPHHVKELYEHEFKQLLEGYYKNITYFGQRVVYGSGIFSESTPTAATGYLLENEKLEKASGILKPVYWIALASDVQLPELPSGVLEQPIADSEITQFWRGLMAERDEKIAHLHNTIASLRDTITGHDGKIAEQQANLKQMLDDQNKVHQNHAIELEKAVGDEQKRNLALASEVSNLRIQLQGIKDSRSWRMTAPLRRIMSMTRVVLLSVSRRILSVYRRLPIGHAAKQGIKNAIFPVFGFGLQRWEPYRQWKVRQEGQHNWPNNNNSRQSVSTSYVPSQLLAAADGVWEWADYGVVKSRIAQAKASRLAQVSPKPLDLIDIAQESLSSAASRVQLPPLVSTPDVSIILPVFNNLKLTLECLLSIAKYSCSDVSYEIIVADDASTDETAQIINSIPNVRLVRNEQNLGFLLNCNRALEHVKGNYVLYLNNDVQVTAGWLSALLNTFVTHPNVGAVGPRFVYPSGHLQEAGVAFRPDGTADMIGLNDDPAKERFSYVRRVDYVSGACLLLPTKLAKQIGGFSEEYLPCYCEDSDLCLSVQQAGYYVYYNPAATIVHHLSKTTGAVDDSFKMRCIYKNLNTLQNKWHDRLEKSIDPKLIAFYLPQFHPMPENDKWWGTGFTEWTNVSKAHPNFVGHYQPRLPADLGYYDLRLSEVMEQQAELARRYGVEGFCFYYYWFDGKRLLDRPIEQMLESGKPDFPFCLCWANENWTRRWDGQDHEVLMAQSHSVEDDTAVILDLIRFFRDQRYIKIDGRPLLLAYRVTLFPDFAQTAARWRTICREQGIGEIYIAMVESFELVHANTHPSEFGCDAAVEFPPQGLAEQKKPSGAVINPNFAGGVADYRDLAVRYSAREAPAYTRFKGVIPGWDNSARRQNNSFCFEHATPGAFQAWLEDAIEETRLQQYGDERLIFVNAWNEWAEGAYLEPDRRFGHTYLEAVKNAFDAARVLKKN
ncbi:methyltransferase domain protein [Collimonas arenae]|uniref:Methyltransferase domain protein n=1 Tax=Collimonas arenae TaxID=279058 RepID=A0A127PLN1_9BURK|nr:glycoside hydrolase family 99-like domain-containing protein [Collimonas arenae]AMO98692.1 methyltransferase domain protein [Collimonas arenae]AMP08582.1 methyltransferase domain protein [Collimonas arenae]